MLVDDSTSNRLPRIINSSKGVSGRVYTHWQGRSQGGKGGNSPPPETEKIVVEKWCYFRKLYF